MTNQSHSVPTTVIKKSKLKLLIPAIIVIIVTYLLMTVMKMTKPQIEKKSDATVIPLVDVVNVQPLDLTIPITSEGMVLPKTSINLTSEASGRVVSVSEMFTAGGIFKKGDVLLEIDSADYELAITRAQANVSAQKAKLDLEQAKSDLAKADWSKYGKKGKPSALNLNLPQVESAKAALAGAKADLKLANRNLEKTKIAAPFDGVILAKMVDLGQFLNVGTSVASLASTEYAEIRVSLSDTQLQQSGLTDSKNVDVKITSDEIQNSQWNGYVSQIEAQRDAKTLMNYAVVTVKHPLTQAAMPLRFNTFVELELKGKTLNSVYPIERSYMMLNNKIRVLDSNSKLRIRDVDVVYADNENFYISKGISSKENLVTTQLPNARSGDLLKVESNTSENK